MITVLIPNALFGELWFLEVDTYDPAGAAPGRKEFVEAMKTSTSMKRGEKVTLSDVAVEYALSPNGALNQHTDIWVDNTSYGDPEDRKAARQFIAQAERLSAKLKKLLAKREENPRASDSMNVEKLGYRLVGAGIEEMREENPVNTPQGRERRRLERQGKSNIEVAKALVAKWPESRDFVCISYSRKHRTAYTELAKELIKRGVAIDYEYQSAEEVESYGSTDGRFRITIKDSTTRIPWDLSEQISAKHNVNFDCYDDEFKGEYEENPRKPVSATDLVRKLKF